MLRGLNNIIQLMHSFEVNIRICQPEKVMSTEAKCFFDDALTELVNRYANRTLIVYCTKDYT